MKISHLPLADSRGSSKGVCSSSECVIEVLLCNVGRTVEDKNGGACASLPAVTKVYIQSDNISRPFKHCYNQVMLKP